MQRTASHVDRRIKIGTSATHTAMVIIRGNMPMTGKPMRANSVAVVATLLLIVVSAIGLPHGDSPSMTHWHGRGWLIKWSLIRYADEGSLQVSIGCRVVVDSYWSRRTAEPHVEGEE